jgi:OmpA-OmpF porin, OOP family
MKSIHALRLLSAAGLSITLAAPALAENDSYFYGGLSVGQSRARIDDERITATLQAAGLTTTGMTRDERDTAYKLFAGYQFNRYIGVEGGYFNLGKFGFTSTTAPAGSLNGQIKLHGLNLDVVGTLPIVENLSLIGRVGAQYAKARDSFSGTGAVIVNNANPSKTDTNYKLGIGVQYAFTPSVLMRAEAEHFRVNDAVGNHGGVNMFSVGLVFPFGRASTPAPIAAAAPAYVAPAPVEAPAPAPIVVAPARTRASFSADSLFSFDHWEVRPEGRAALDTFTRELKGSQYEVISVEGHTDRLGSTAYNEKLSTKRAESVKDYLITSGGIDASKISAVGKGESMPSTKPDDCKGDKRNAKLIACLQPDRRVEVEVTGTR